MRGERPMDNTCFVIMPFGNAENPDKVKEFSTTYKHIIVPAVQSVDLKCVRCDEILEAGWIHKKMVEHIYRAPVAVVDITDLNANVFWELGVRQALCSHVTVMIRRKGTRVPFNVRSDNVIEYDPQDPESVDDTKTKIARFIKEGLDSQKTDSMVHDLLNLKVQATSPPIDIKKTTAFEVLAAPGHQIRIITGDLKNVRDIPVWVNSENTNMQMARFFDRSISSMIRYMGAEKALGNVVRDVIAEELAKAMGNEKTVPPAHVIVTGAGDLAKTHGVKNILHVAAVTGAIGRGYCSIDNLSDCVTNVLDEADKLGAGSVLLPLLGAGTAGGEISKNVPRLIDAAVAYFSNNPTTKVLSASFLAYTENELVECLRALHVPSVKQLAG
jgi:O-acetyl-ADP-ribose deacetylase (regulator of RNase III)